MAHRSLGLDLGNITGYAICEGRKIVQSGERDFRSKVNNTKGHKGNRMLAWLQDLGAVDEIYVEGVMFGGNSKKKDGSWGAGASRDHHELYHGFLMIVEMHAAALGIPMIMVWPGTLKKDFVGHGGAEKMDICEMLHERGWKNGKRGTALNDNEADACALLCGQMEKRFGLYIDF